MFFKKEKYNSKRMIFEFFIFWFCEEFEGNEVLELEPKEPKLATVLTNTYNEFDPYGAMSTPLYQTSTFKQVKY